jgi:CrcB protein
VKLDARELAAIFAGGFLGAIARAELVEALPHDPGEWPWATFLVNVAGAFMLGYFVTRLQERLPLSAYRRPFLGTGLCGALTTFSTMPPATRPRASWPASSPWRWRPTSCGGRA